MSALFVLPGLISLYLVLRGRIGTAFLSVYLPALILLPNGYGFHIPHLPQISAAQGALIPIGIVALVRLVKSGVPSLLDVLMVLFMISTATSEVLRERITNDGIFMIITSFLSIFVAYAVGRMIIEPGLRLATVRRIVVLVLLLGPVGLIEWRLGQNIYGVIGQRVFQTTEVHPNVQYRSGHGRMSASFNDAELAGIVFGMTLPLNSWLFFLSKKKAGEGYGKIPRWIEKFHVPGILLFGYLLSTQSRGPLVAVAAAWVVLQLSRFKNRKLALFLVAILLGAGGYWGYVNFLRYTNISTSAEIADEMQGSAFYRRQMNELYQPIAKQGGWFGWGILSHPMISGMASIDNEYLLVHLSYGLAGLILFLLIAAETFRRLVSQLWRRQAESDQAFAISLMSAMAVFWIAIYTVYMGEQLPQIAFLLVGWSQSIVPAPLDSESLSVEARPSKFAFRRVYS
jgi:hypothetical protein